MIFNHFLEMYLIFYTSVMLHELAHAIVAVVIDLPIEQFKIGDDMFAVKVGKFSISLNCLYGSCVSFNSEVLKKKKRKQICAFFLSGSIVNLAIIVFAMSMDLNSFYKGMLMWINVYNLLASVFPLVPRGNDLNKMLSYIKLEKEL